MKDSNLETVHRQTPSRFGRTILKLGNNRMVYILLLFTQELGTYGIECVTSQLILPLHELQDIKLQPTI